MIVLLVAKGTNKIRIIRLEDSGPDPSDQGLRWKFLRRVCIPVRNKTETDLTTGSRIIEPSPQTAYSHITLLANWTLTVNETWQPQERTRSNTLMIS